MREKVDDEASCVLGAMLTLSRPHESKLREERSPPLPEAEILAATADSALAAELHLTPDRVPGVPTPPAPQTAACAPRCACAGRSYGRCMRDTAALSVRRCGSWLASQVCCCGWLQTRRSWLHAWVKATAGPPTA